MNDPPRILIVDDNESNRAILCARLASQGYELAEAGDGEEALAAIAAFGPDLVLLDIMMPKLNGLEVCRRLRADVSAPFVPIILVTALADGSDVVAGLDAGADEYLIKPIDQHALLARVRSMLRIKGLHDKAQGQAEELALWNRELERRVAEQLEQIERASRLKHFLSPEVVDIILSSGGEAALASHRREVTVLFCDLRGFTAFAEIAEPEEVMSVIREYRAALGALIRKFQGTLERFAGDGLMIIFNDPAPCPDPCARAVRMAAAMRERFNDIAGRWRAGGHMLGFGVGIAHGYATLGAIGFEGRLDYGAIGTVVNLAARLCAEAQDGQILIDARVHGAVADIVQADSVGEMQLKGLHRKSLVFDVRALTR
jgi:class 3 adenylate cyclase/CheY-like chemotaxis protein